MDRKNHRLIGPVLCVSVALLAGQIRAAEGTEQSADNYSHFSMMHMHHGDTASSCPAMKDGAGTAATGMDGWQMRLDALGITAEQKTAIQQVAQSYRDRGLALAQRGSGIRDQWMNVTPDEPAYPQATEDAAATAARLVADGIRLAGEMRAEMYAVLTPEQRQQLKDQVTQDRQRWEEWRSRHQAPSE